MLLRRGHGAARRAHRLAPRRRGDPPARGRGLARVPLPPGDGPRDRRDDGRALHGVFHGRLPRAGAARARARGARDVTLTYTSAGVDVGRAEDALPRGRERITRTKRPEGLGDVGQFGGLFASPGGDTVLVATTDGVGTKLELARILDRHAVGRPGL